MSRSVQLLRTTFQDHAVWKPLLKMLHNASDEVLRLASSTLCNLLLEFSPSKEPILESGVVDMLVGLTRRDDQVDDFEGDLVLGCGSVIRVCGWFITENG